MPCAVMRADEFARAVETLPADLRDLARQLWPYVRENDCALCERIGGDVMVALDAARYDQFEAAASLIGQAERLVTAHDAEGDPACRTRRIDLGRAGDGRVARWAGRPGPLVAATDASWKGRAGGIAYVVSDGRWGLRGLGTGRLDPTGRSRVLVNELRAVELLLARLGERSAALTVLVDNVTALSYLRRWQGGETDAMPDGYSLRQRIRSEQPTLVRLAELVQRLPRVTFTHVKGHDLHPLNEAADALASMARRRIGEVFDVRQRAEALVDAFLRDWHHAD